MLEEVWLLVTSTMRPRAVWVNVITHLVTPAVQPGTIWSCSSADLPASSWRLLFWLLLGRLWWLLFWCLGHWFWWLGPSRFGWLGPSRLRSCRLCRADCCIWLCLLASRFLCCNFWSCRLCPHCLFRSSSDSNVGTVPEFLLIPVSITTFSGVSVTTPAVT